MLKPMLIAGVAIATLAGCSRETEALYPTRQPTLTYENYERYGCRELAVEIQRVAAALRYVGGLQNEDAADDEAAIGITSVVFPLAPYGYLLAQKDEFGAEVARLKGQYEALREAAGVNHCADALMRPASIAEAPGGDVIMDLALPGGPKPFEGTPASAFTSAQIDAYCAVHWNTTVDPETGRTLYNPCRARLPYAD